MGLSIKLREKIIIKWQKEKGKKVAWMVAPYGLHYGHMGDWEV